jgi:uncharacterized membrane protein YfcA
MTLAHGLLFLLAVALATCAQTLSGFAFALVLVGLGGLLQLAPLADLANVVTVLALANAAIALRGARESLDRPGFRQIALGMLAGTIAGIALLDWLSANLLLVLRLLLGLTVIGCAVIVLLEAARLQQRSRPVVFLAWGVVSGLLSGLFSTGGPPLVYHLYRQPLALKAVRDTLVAALAFSSLARLLVVVPLGGFSLHALQLCAMAAPLVFGLTWWLERHPPAWSRAAVLRLVCGLLFLTGLGLALPATLKLLMLD